jgi:hypothetical protein
MLSESYLSALKMTDFTLFNSLGSIHTSSGCIRSHLLRLGELVASYEVRLSFACVMPEQSKRNSREKLSAQNHESMIEFAFLKFG